MKRIICFALLLLGPVDAQDQKRTVKQAMEIPSIPPAPKQTTPGRFQMFTGIMNDQNGSATQLIFRLDTATGEMWVMDMHPASISKTPDSKVATTYALTPVPVDEYARVSTIFSAFTEQNFGGKN